MAFNFERLGLTQFTTAKAQAVAEKAFDFMFRRYCIPEREI